MRTHRYLPAIALALLLAACGGKTPEQHLQEGKEALEARKFPAAVIHLKSALQANPAAVDTRILLGRALQGRGEWEASEHEFSRARELGATAETVLPLLSQSLLKQGKHKEVLALELPKTGIGSVALATLRAQRAMALLATGQLPEAAAAINDGERILSDAGHTAPHDEIDLAKAGLAYSRNELDPALALLDAIQKRNPTRVDVGFIRANVLKSRNDQDGAIKQYQRIIEANPEEFPAYAALADLQIAKGALFHAEKSVSKLESLTPKPLAAHLLRARLEMRKGEESNLKKALESVQAAQKMTKDNPLVLALSAEINERLGNHETSFKDASQSLTLLPGQLGSSIIVARAHLRNGQPKQTLAELDKLGQATAGDPQLLLLRGEAQIAMGDTNGGLATLNKLAALAPKSSEVAIQQARAHTLAGNPDKAVERLEYASKLESDQGQADEMLINWYLGKNQPQKAMQAAENYLRKKPASLTARNLKASILASMNRADEARSILEPLLREHPDNFTAAANLATLDLKKKQPGAAKARFQQFLSQNPRSVDAMLALANIAASEKNPGEYVRMLEAAIKEKPAAVSLRSRLIEHYLVTKDKKKALAEAKAAADANPGLSGAMVVLARTQLVTGETERALSSYAQAVTLAPKSADASMLMGLAQLNHGKAGEARAALERAFSLGGRKPDLYSGLIKLETWEGRLTQALDYARQFRQAAPRSVLAMDQEGELLLRLNRTAEAIAPLRAAVNLSPSSTRVNRLHGALAANKQGAEAEKLMSEWMKKAPKDYDLRFYMANFHERQSQNKEAMALYQSVLALRPDHVPTLNNLALLLRKSDLHKAIESAEKALKLAPGEANLRDTLGLLLDDKGEKDRALHLFQEAVKLGPSNPTFRYHLARAYAGKGRQKEVVETLGAVLKSGQPFPERKEAEALYRQAGGQ